MDGSPGRPDRRRYDNRIPEDNLIPKIFHEIELIDISNLMENKVPEGSTIEYKSELPHEGESKKIPFLAEVSAFANTSGGDLIFGVIEQNGFIKSIDGVRTENPDREILRLENAIRSGIDPRLPSVHVRAVPIDTDVFLFIIRVPQSWNAPHRVVFSNHSKFYGRSSAGKYPLDVSQLRTAFLRSERLSDKIHSFREERTIGLLTEQQRVLNLRKGGRLVLHLIPLSAFAGLSGNRISPKTELSQLFPPIGGGGWNYRMNIDGVMTYSEDSERYCVSYCQLFRSGIVEAVTVFTPMQNSELILPSVWYEREILKATKRYLAGLEKHDIETPIYMTLSLVGMKDYHLGVGHMFFRSGGDSLDRELILLPESILDDYDADIPKAFQPIFDMVWNAFGYERSYNYNEQGEWVGTP